MSTDTVATFEGSLEWLEVDWTHASSDGLAGALEEHCPEPVVGVEPPYDGVDLPDWVNTNLAPADLHRVNAGVMAVGLGIMDYGGVVARGTPDGIEPMSLLGNLHIAVLRRSDIVPGTPETFDWLGEEFRTGRSLTIIATGLSATADTGVLVKGMHGPKDVHVATLDE